MASFHILPGSTASSDCNSQPRFVLSCRQGQSWQGSPRLGPRGGPFIPCPHPGVGLAYRHCGAQGRLAHGPFHISKTPPPWSSSPMVEAGTPSTKASSSLMPWRKKVSAWSASTTPWRYPKGAPGDMMKKWLGGYFEVFWSVNPHWTADFKSFPKHPITRGVKPFSLKDEWYYHMKFRDNMKGVTPILSALPPGEYLEARGWPAQQQPPCPEISPGKKRKAACRLGFGETQRTAGLWGNRCPPSHLLESG